MANIKIDLPGGIPIEVPGWATEDTLLKISSALNVQGGTANNFNSALRKAIKMLGGGSGNTKGTFNQAVDQAAKGTQKLAQEEMKAANAFKKAREVLADMTDVAGSLLGGDGSFKMLDLAAEKTAKAVEEAAGSFLDNIPGVKSFTTAVAKGGEAMIKFNNAVAQDTLQMLSGLGKQGFGLGDNLLDLTTKVLSTGLSLDAFTAVVTTNQAAILTMGQDFEAGVKKFVDAQAILTDTDGPFRTGMKMFGYSIEESAAFMGDFIEANKYNLNLQKMTADEVAARTFEYAKNLNVIAEATGQQADEIRERRLGLMAEGALQGKLQQMILEGRGAEAQAISDFIATIQDPAIRQAAIEYYAFDGALVTKQSNMVAMALDGLLNAFDTKSIDDLKVSQASLAQNSNLLNIATLSLAENAGPFAQLVADLVPLSQKAFSLLGGKTVFDLIGERDKDLQAPVDEFGASLIEVGVKLEALPNQIAANLIQPLEGFLSAQLGVLRFLLGNGTSYTPEQTAESNKIIEDYATSAEFLASGGPTGGGLYLVGERGPELLKLNQGSMGHVYNHGQTKSMLAQGMAVPGRFGGGGVIGQMFEEKLGKAYPKLANTIQPLGNGNTGISFRFDKDGVADAMYSTLGDRVQMSIFKDGLVEIEQSLAGDAKNMYNLRQLTNGKMGMGQGYAVGVQGKEGGGVNQYGEYPDGSRTNTPEGMTEMMKSFMKAQYDIDTPDSMNKELLEQLKENNKTLKKMFTKVFSRDGFF